MRTCGRLSWRRCPQSGGRAGGGFEVFSSCGRAPKRVGCELHDPDVAQSPTHDTTQGDAIGSNRELGSELASSAPGQQQYLGRRSSLQSSSSASLRGTGLLPPSRRIHNLNLIRNQRSRPALSALGFGTGSVCGVPRRVSRDGLQRIELRRSSPGGTRLLPCRRILQSTFARQHRPRATVVGLGFDSWHAVRSVLQQSCART